MDAGCQERGIDESRGPTCCREGADVQLCQQRCIPEARKKSGFSPSSACPRKLPHRPTLKPSRSSISRLDGPHQTVPQVKGAEGYSPKNPLLWWLREGRVEPSWDYSLRSSSLECSEPEPQTQKHSNELKILLLISLLVCWTGTMNINNITAKMLQFVKRLVFI